FARQPPCPGPACQDIPHGATRSRPHEASRERSGESLIQRCRLAPGAVSLSDSGPAHSTWSANVSPNAPAASSPSVLPLPNRQHTERSDRPHGPEHCTASAHGSSLEPLRERLAHCERPVPETPATTEHLKACSAPPSRWLSARANEAQGRYVD